MRWHYLAIWLLLAGCTGAAVRTTVSELEIDYLRVTFLDVGGDSILIETPEDKRVLIDAGDVNSSVLQWLQMLNVSDIDMAIATHPDKDHIGGFLELTGMIDVILEPNVSCTTKVCSKLFSAFDEENVSYGYSIGIDDKLSMEILNPRGIFEDDNDNSIVLRVDYGETSFLFTGDCERACEKALLKEDIDVDVLKIAHHGSKSSTTQEFLDAVSPKIAVIGVGPNKYGHPSDITIQKLAGIEWYRTDEGTIRVISDGKKFAVERLQVR